MKVKTHVKAGPTTINLSVAVNTNVTVNVHNNVTIAVTGAE
jgi:hypothetical protein